ncbi:N-acetylmuramoyl-L-alanine amidase [Clostridium sardiniense]
MTIKKIAVRGGHNFSVPGANGIMSETKEDRLIKDSVIKWLRKGGAIVLDVTAPDSCNTVNSDLVYGVNKANNWGADLFVSCHFNKAYGFYDGAIGSEVWTYSSNFGEAVRTVNELASLGFKNRGVKHSTHLYELRATSCPSMIVETCFVEATKDVELYRKLGADRIGKAIAEGILNGNINGSIESKPSEPSHGTHLWEQCISGQIVEDLQSELNKQYRAGLKVDGYFGEGTLNACPLVRQGAQGNITKIIQRRLLERGYTSLNQHGGADGSFGAGTTTAIKNLQRNKGLSADGIVGKDTWRALFRK